MPRPLKFKSVKELDKLIKEYFEEYEEKEKPLTVEMLCCKLGIRRQTLLNYEGISEEYMDTVKDAKEYILATKVENLNRKQTNTAGIIFDLCNNGDYSNKHQEEREKGTTIIINDKSKEVNEQN